MNLKFEIKNNIAWAILNRPKKLNALNPAVYEELDKILAKVELNREIRALVITGDERAFAAGADIEHMAEGSIRDVCEFTDQGMRIQDRLCNLPIPTIAAISGYCFGGGLELALCCDFRIAGDNALLGLPEISLGIIPGGGGTQRLPRIVGKNKALKMIMTGKPEDANKALEIGLVDEVVDKNALFESVSTFVNMIIKQPAMALRAAKIAVNNSSSTSLQQGIQMEKDLFCMLFGTADQKEGMKSFLEKRKPHFKGE